MGGRSTDDGMLPQPGRIRIRCSGIAESASAPGTWHEAIYFGDDFSVAHVDWVCPIPAGWSSGDPGLSVTILAVGCGGQGGIWPDSGGGGDDLARGGGGGGACVEVTFEAIPGETYELRGATYGAFYDHTHPTTVKLAGESDFILIADNGLTPYSSGNGAEGGQAANCVGDTIHAGGAGSARASTSIGGGGGSAGGPMADGIDASGQSGAASVGHGDGGDGGNSDTNGEGGSTPADIADFIEPGGGGGGRGDDTVGGITPGSGNGGASYVKISWFL
jgi:hypothetical protein